MSPNKVGIIMGSDSDLPTMEAAECLLLDLGIPYELEIVSAHRTPDKMYDYGKNAAENGFAVIIAGAGGAAHLPGMIASLTHLPVIGVPVESKSLKGVDSLHSIVQMPRGVPVASVAIGNSLNAGLLAARILAIGDENLAKRLKEWIKNQEETVLKKNEAVKRSHS